MESNRVVLLWFTPRSGSGSDQSLCDDIVAHDASIELWALWFRGRPDRHEMRSKCQYAHYATANQQGSRRMNAGELFQRCIALQAILLLEEDGDGDMVPSISPGVGCMEEVARIA